MTCPAPRRNNRGMPPSSERVVTEKESRVLAYVLTYRQQHGFSPSARDACAHFGWASTNTWQCYLRAFVAKRLVTNEAKVARSLLLTESGTEAAETWLREQEGRP
ncbi:hypothetical protein Mx8p17 [Myxococcus phage Mx8]|uniref:p17 n=1 Tax=Myxococcus phage Mx8 TaxID=49964 RepID=Q94MV2_9CAUD|nr:hypothetical protein Mx8p17 [Myxococcus phage Mx8]AAK94352.1 p17 [Myxococcus phage Mx8]